MTPTPEPATGKLGNRLTANVPLVLGSLLIFDSMHFIWAGLLHPYLPPSVSALYVLGTATVQTGLFLHWRGGIDWGVLWRHRWLFLSIGFLVGVSTNINYTAVGFIDPGVATLLSKSSILFSLSFGFVWLQERLNRWQGVGAVLAIIGVLVISFQPGDLWRLGSVLVLTSAFLYAFHAAIVKRFAGELDLATFFFFRLLLTTVWMLFIRLPQGGLLLPSWQGGLLILLTATFDVALSRALYYAALKRLTLSMHTLILTLSPVLAVIWSLILFDHRLTWQEVLGGVAVIAGIVVLNLSRRQPRPVGQSAT